MNNMGSELRRSRRGGGKLRGGVRRLPRWTAAAAADGGAGRADSPAGILELLRAKYGGPTNDTAEAAAAAVAPGPAAADKTADSAAPPPWIAAIRRPKKPSTAIGARTEEGRARHLEGPTRAFRNVRSAGVSLDILEMEDWRGAVAKRMRAAKRRGKAATAASSAMVSSKSWASRNRHGASLPPSPSSHSAAPPLSRASPDSPGSTNTHLTGTAATSPPRRHRPAPSSTSSPATRKSILRTPRSGARFFHTPPTPSPRASVAASGFSLARSIVKGATDAMSTAAEMGTSVAATDHDSALRVKREDAGWWGAGVSAPFSPRGAFEKVVLARMERSTKGREMGAPRVLTHNEASRALRETNEASDVATFGDLTHDGVDHEQNTLTRSPRLGESAFSIYDYNSTFSRTGPSDNVTVAPQPEAVSPGNNLAKGGIVEQVLEEDEDRMWDRIFSGDVQDLENRDFPSAQREEIWTAHNAAGISPQHDLIGDSLDGRQVDSADRQSWRPVDRQPLSQRPPSPDAQLFKSCGVTAAVEEAVEDESAALASRVAALESDVEAIHAAMAACLDRVRIVEQTVF